MGIKDHFNSASWEADALKLSLNLFFNSNLGLSLAIPSRSHFISTAAPARPALDPSHSQADVLKTTKQWGLGQGRKGKSTEVIDTTSDLICPTQKLQKAFYSLINCLLVQLQLYFFSLIPGQNFSLQDERSEAKFTLLPKTTKIDKIYETMVFATFGHNKGQWSLTGKKPNWVRPTNATSNYLKGLFPDTQNLKEFIIIRPAL